jgi:hypothetical protein
MLRIFPTTPILQHSNVPVRIYGSSKIKIGI